MTVVNYQTDADLAILSVNHPPVNALSHAVRAGLCEGIDRANAEDSITAVVIICQGRTFFAGADISEFGTPAQLKEPRLRSVQKTIEESAKPVIAAIHGTALGGGLELALACHWRVASADAKVGLPEVKLGLIPGAGGTQRLPRLVGPEVAMEMSTSGNHFDAQFALDKGIVDVLVETDLLAGASEYARRVVSEARPLRVISRVDDKVTGVDPEVFANFRKKIARKAHGQLAPWKCIEAVEMACNNSFQVGSEFEAAAFQECLKSPQRGALTYLFHAERAAKKIPDVPTDLKPLDINSVAIIGSGTMGGGIAMNFVNAGIPVTLIDVSDEALARGMSIIEKNYTRSVSRGSRTQQQMDQAMSLIRSSTDNADVADVDLVIEAVFEDMDLKKQIFSNLDKLAASHTILASNTSSLDIDEIASVTSRPEKVIGMHFFSPANVMKLLENVRGARTSAETIATIMSLSKRIGKVPVLAGNCDGFIGNRMLQYYTGKSEFLLEEGATPEQVDQVIMDFGMPMGPLAMRDLAGIDVGLLIRKSRAASIPADERFSPILDRLSDMGRLGQKSGAGFYRYEGRERIVDLEVTRLIEAVSEELGIERRQLTDEEILASLLHPLVNEGAKLLEDGIALRASDIDVVYTNGYGFPTYLGGPMYWAEQIGLEKVYQTAVKLGEKHGQRWQPSALLERLAKEGKGWNSM